MAVKRSMKLGLRKKPANLVIQIWNKIFSETTFNNVVKFNFLIGHYLYFYPIRKPEIVQDEPGMRPRVKIITHYTTLNRVINKLVVYGLLGYCGFEVLQMIRFMPTDGFTRRTISVVFYFNVTFLGFVMAKTYDDSYNLIPEAWNWIEYITQYVIKNGCPDAWKWKRSFIVVYFMISCSAVCYSVALTLTGFYMLKPNNTAHLFYLLPEKWKPYKISYLVMVAWQLVMILGAIYYVLGVVIIAVAVIYNTRHCANCIIKNDFRKPNGATVEQRIKMTRQFIILDKMANAAAAHFFIPFLTLNVIVSGTLFTYIAITRFNDASIDTALYFVIVTVDIILVGIVTAIYTEAGKYEDHSHAMIVNARASLNEKRILKSGKARLYRMYVRTLTPFGLKVGNFATLNDETTKMMHETIIDYLMLLLSP